MTLRTHRLRIAARVLHRSTSGTSDAVTRVDNGSVLERGAGYLNEGRIGLMLEDTGNGFIACWLPTASWEQRYYVCLDYSQARDLVLALSAFTAELGFADTPHT